jgi:hypothetical protein
MRILFLLIIVLCSCAVKYPAQKELNGVFKTKNDNTYFVGYNGVFQITDSSYLFQWPTGYSCDASGKSFRQYFDTASTGSVLYDRHRGLLNLFSAHDDSLGRYNALPSPYSTVRTYYEEEQAYSKDSIYVFLKSPLFDNPMSNNKYMFHVYYFGGDTIEYSFTTKTTCIVFPNAERIGVDYFIISVEPDISAWDGSEYFGIYRAFLSRYFVRNNQKNNVLRFDAPTLDENFMKRMRFRGELIKVLDKDHLEWKGLIYERFK